MVFQKIECQTDTKEDTLNGSIYIRHKRTKLTCAIKSQNAGNPSGILRKQASSRRLEAGHALPLTLLYVFLSSSFLECCNRIL